MDSSIWVATITGFPAKRQRRMISFWRPGTSSGASSTPRSPRATMKPSALSTISERWFSAAGFSILAMIAARPAIRRRPSAMSSGRWTKDIATQSTPRSRPNCRSRRSFSVRGEMFMTTPGRLTPLWSFRVPPVTISVSAKSRPSLVTRRRSLPSSSRISASVARASKISGCGRGARSAPPGAGSRSRRKCAPGAKLASPPTSSPTRSFGPCRSRRTPIGWSSSRSRLRITSRRARWSSCVPWLKFRRNTSAPASTRARMVLASEEEGPRVATILALRIRRMRKD